MQLVCVGHASVDHHFEIEAFDPRPTKTPASSYRMIVGGMAANAAVAAAKLGAPVRLLGRVGDDAAGHFLRQEIAALGVEQHLELVKGCNTSVSSVVVDAQGERQIFNHRGNALENAHPLDLAQLAGATALLVDPRWGDGAAAALTWARQQRIVAVLDADIAPRHVLERLVPLAQWAVFSERGLACYAPEASHKEALGMARAAGANFAMVTLGERGVRWMQGDFMEQMKGFGVQALDTTGAGDVFHSAFTLALAGWVQGAVAQVHAAAHEPILFAIRLACAAAAIKCTRRHGVLGAPSLQEVLAFMQK